MEIEENEETKKNEKKYTCTLCNYKCSYFCDWNRHISTRKHLVSHKMEIEENEETFFGEKNESLSCYCGKSYNSKSGLYKHKKSCHSNNKNSSKENIKNTEKIELHDLVDLVKVLVKENSSLKNMMMEQQHSMIEKVLDSQSKFIEQTNNVTRELVKNGVSNTIHNTTNNNNSNNKAFNLNFFLNETCKNAMNINDFVDSIKLQLSDLISIGELGYVEGISNIIVKKLNDLDETERPIHCTDKKRETIYIKDEDKWEKDDEEKKKLRKVIGKIAYKNQKMFPQFKERYPDYNDSTSKHSDQYSKIVIESFEDSNKEKQDKIIKKITKEILIDK